MLARFRHWLWLLAVTLTQGVINTLLAGLWWVLTGRGIAPDPDEAFSSRVGRYAMQGSKWALIAERLIDGLFGRGHCRASAANHERRCG
jgi:hypothetical protein